MNESMHIVVVERHASGHHPSYLSAILESIASIEGSRVSALLSAEVYKHPNVAASVAAAGVTANKLPVLPSYKNLRHQGLSWQLYNLRTFAALSREIHELEKETSTPSIIFFPCLYDLTMRGFSLSRFVFPYDIGGIYMNSAAFRTSDADADADADGAQVNALRPQFMRDRRTRCLALLDEAIVRPVADFAAGAIVGSVPDFAVIGPKIEPQCWDEIQSKADGRPIIGLWGYLKRSKGILTFQEIASRLKNEAFFVAAGELPVGEFRSDEVERLRVASSQQDSGFLLIEGRIESDGEFQELVGRSHIVYCAYEGFLSSSNQVSLAAVQGVPVVSLSKGCIADAVRRFGLGVLAYDSSIDSITVAIRELLSRTRSSSDQGCRPEIITAFSRGEFCRRLALLVQEAATGQLQQARLPSETH